MPAEHGTRLLRLVNGKVKATEVERCLIGAGAVPVTAAGPHGGGEAHGYAVEFSRDEVIAPGDGSMAHAGGMGA